MTDAMRQHIETALRDSEQYFKQGQWFIGGVGLVCLVGSLIREIYFLAVFSVVFFGGLVALMRYAQKRTRNHPIRRTILEQPERITRVAYRKASSSSGAFPTYWLDFADDSGNRLGLRFEEGVLHALAPFLARHFSNATIEIPGFDPARDVARP
jgi:hypothetical protein